MNKNYKTLKIMLITIFAILFSGIHVSADRGRGCGHHGGMYQCQGWHHRGHGGPGCGDLENLGKDEIKKLDEARTAFFEATKDLRRKIYQKRLELASELAKEDPDAAAASAIQKEISDFKAKMAQHRLEHILRVQKINPDLGRGFWGGGPMGHDMIHRGKMEPCGKRHRGPMNCLHGAPGRGCGRGPQMMRSPSGCAMGPGMMEPVGNLNWSPGNCPYDAPAGGMGPGYSKGPGMKVSDGPQS
jgi:hypothetical protein